MTTITLARKTTTIETVLVQSEEDEKLIRSWLAEMFLTDLQMVKEEAETLANLQDISPLIEEKARFARDTGSKIVYIIPAEDFETDFEVVAE